MQVAITGATGQMGGNIIEKVQEENEIEINLLLDKKESNVNGLKIKNDENTEKLLKQKDIDVIIDFTVPEATIRYVNAAAETKTPIIIGTTGFNQEQLNQIKEAAETIPILKASNFSPSINVMRQLIKEAAEKLDNYNIEITETHHNKKRDAPSGTAETMLKDLKQVRENLEPVYGREGEAPRSENEVGIHALRAGDIKGSHEVMLAGNEEVLKIRHRSESRQVFASGAVKAAKWINHQREGFYNFEQVLKE